MAPVIVSNRSGFEDFQFCVEYLPKVSRTFAINVRILRGETYRGVLLAYLLCRIADTIEDDHHFPVSFKIEKLHEYAGLFPPSPDFVDRIEKFLVNIKFAGQFDSATLLLNTSRVFRELVRLPKPVISVISKYVKEMALGMAGFQEKGRSGDVVFLETQKELERYCYFVAGTVGLMLTDLFGEGSKRISQEIKQRLEKRSVGFGLGLQMTNIAKDFFGDRRRGWCYVPRSFFVEAGVDPLSDSAPGNSDGLLNVQKRLITLALGYLDEAMIYTMDLPRILFRYRLFCAWPLFMAAKTLAKLYSAQSFSTHKVVKISRDDVKRIVQSTSLAIFSNRALQFLYDRIRPLIR